MEFGFQDNSAQGFPQMIILDISNVCNLACVHCPQAALKKRSDYKPTFLSLELYKKLIDEIACHSIELLRFTGDGEPLLHKDILRMIGYAKERGVRGVNLTTNGMLLEEEVSRELLERSIDFIDISLDAYFKKTYQKIRRGADYNKVLSNVHRLIYLRNRMKSPARIMVNMIRQEIAEEEIELFRAYWAEQADFVLVRNLHSANDLVKIKRNRPADEKRYPCPHLWKRMTIDFEGNVKFCAHDWYGQAIIGNVNHGTIQQIWQDGKYNQVRSAHLAGEFAQVPICADCRDWTCVPWDYGYDKVIKEVAQ